VFRIKGEMLLYRRLFNFASEYTIRKVQENQVGLKLNDTHQLLVYADANLLVDNITPTKENTDALTNASMETGQEVNIETQVYIDISSPECREKS
jgi:hypothetical protein